MCLRQVTRKKYDKNIFCSLKVIEERIRIPELDPDPEPDLLVRGTDPRIWIRTKMSRIPSTA
jgi:hypothetical protein